MIKINKGEIWMVKLDPTVGREQAKTRPCLIISSNRFNQGLSELAIVIPLTSKQRHIPLHIPVEPLLSGLSIKSYLMCEQIRSVSTKRLGNLCGKVDEDTLNKVEYIIKMLLDFY